MPSRDCLLWVGKSYSTSEKFLREAEQRGCCRKVSTWPSWAEPGKTRVFLAHHNGFTSAARGVLVGYYTLGGVDVVMTQEDCDEYKALQTECAARPSGRTSPRTLRSYWKTSRGRKQVEPLLDFWRKRFPNGGLPCRIPPKREPRDPLDDAVIDFLLDFLISCEPGAQPHGHAGYGLSTDQTRLECLRGCGMRDKPEAPGSRPSVYLVDKLEREIAEEFCDVLKEILKAALEGEEKKQRRPKGKRRSRPRAKGREESFAALRRAAAEQSDRQGGIDEFREIVNELHGRKNLQARVPHEIRRIAHERGAMVLFQEPYPAFHVVPQAACRGLKRIDGNDLLRRVRDACRKAPRGDHPEFVLPVWAG